MPSPRSPALFPVILSGGSGTRLWPLSRRSHPKQLQPLASENSLLQETARRVGDADRFQPPLVVCNDDHRFVIAEQLRALGITPLAIALEPVARNTAPAIATAALIVAEVDPAGTLLVLPSDHVILDRPAFMHAIDCAAAAARAGRLTTFGIVPEHPETGFGYIQRGEPLEGIDGAFTVARFVEKPDAERARAFVESGDYAWNSGMFVFPVRALLEELERFQPDLVSACRDAVANAQRDLTFTRLDAAAFGRAEAISIDHALMEKTGSAAVVPCEIGWSDVGSWGALWEIGRRDERGNVVQGDVLLHDVENAYVRSESRLVAAVGVRDLVVVETADALLVAPRDRAQDVKEIVAQLDRAGRPEADRHALVHRPWGAYSAAASGDHFLVRQISVKPGGRLSLQRHRHRAEHWVVVQGRARVTIGDDVSEIERNQSTYIPPGVPHRLENPGEAELTVIEVQSGDYLGEDDIERLEPAGEPGAAQGRD
jgi:mannose-1-phosphate guanylyltransferase/mannose-6-phosphate isomerase